MRLGIGLSTLVLLLLATIPLGAPRQIGKPKMKPIIRQVDHILIQTSDAKYLFDFLADTLQLPVAWPLADYSGFTSGGVAAGNVNIEVLRFADQKESSSTRRSKAHFIQAAA